MILSLIVSLLINALAFWAAPLAVPCWSTRDAKQSYQIAAGYSVAVTVIFMLGIGSFIAGLPGISLLPAFLVVALLSFAITTALVLGVTSARLVEGFTLKSTQAGLIGCAVVTGIQTVLSMVISHII